MSENTRKNDVEITDYRIQKLSVPCKPPISDSQTDNHRYAIGYLQIHTDTEYSGIGLGGVSAAMSPSQIESQFDSVGKRIIGKSPFSLCMPLSRPRGGNYSRSTYGTFQRVVDFALWDLCAKHLDLPLYRLFGGDDPRVPAYVSGLLFTVDDKKVSKIYSHYSDMGFDAAKVKVGYRTVEEDIRRLELIEDAFGGDCILMVDANEAWSPKQAIRRVHEYQKVGFDILWVEDPVFREDIAGMQKVSNKLPNTYTNFGEYVNLEGKRNILENHVVDILNIRTGMFSESFKAAIMAHAYGIPTHVGNTQCDIGVHLAAALPELTYIEWWDRPWDLLSEESIVVEDGMMEAPNRPGHGISVSDQALSEFGC